MLIEITVPAHFRYIMWILSNLVQRFSEVSKAVSCKIEIDYAVVTIIAFVFDDKWFDISCS